MDSLSLKSEVSAREGKYLTFMLAGEVYGVDVMNVREIVALLPITPVPRTPLYIKGVINLRGRIIPVIDLRVRFGMTVQPAQCILIVETQTLAGHIIMGILADSVCEVLTVKAPEIEPVPSFGIQVDTSFLLGVTRANGSLRLLLDIDRVLTAEEMAETKAAGDSAQAQDQE
jgi:purine-binding chemotaxis protein CheW